MTPQVPTDDPGDAATVGGYTATQLRNRSNHTGTQGATTVDYDNTTSGLVASEVQAAIDELAAAPGGGGGEVINVNHIVDDTNFFTVSLTSADHQDPADAQPLGIELEVTGDGDRPMKVDVNLPMLSAGNIAGGYSGPIVAPIGVWDGTTFHTLGVFKYRSGEGFSSVHGSCVLPAFSGTKTLALRAYFSVGPSSYEMEIYAADWATVDVAERTIIATFLDDPIAP